MKEKWEGKMHPRLLQLIKFELLKNEIIKYQLLEDVQLA